MPKRDNSREGNILRSGSLETPATVADEIYDDPVSREVRALEASRHVADPVSIMALHADLKQPRRTMPGVVRAQWDGTAQAVGAMLEYWHSLAEQEREQPFPLGSYLEDVIGIDRPDEEAWERYPLSSSYLELVSLAADIRRKGGLTNDLTIVRQAQGYLIETGERRWLAHHLLYRYFQDDRWSRITARIEKQFSRQRQASENGARANLNAIARARQLSLLIIDAIGEDKFKSFEEIAPAGVCDRYYYAQVADGDEVHLPHGLTETVLDAMGLKSKSQFRQYRALLRIPDDLWEYADDANLSEGAIRTAMQKKKSVTTVTHSKPHTIRVAVSILPKLEKVRSHLKGLDDTELLDRLIDYYLEHEDH